MPLWIEQRVADDILARSKEASPRETGGLLVGYCAGVDVVVTSLIGPGPRAMATAISFVPDTEFQRRELANIYRASAGHATYVGDWHSHPFGVACMSSRDCATLRIIARDKRTRLKHPVMLIAAGQDNDWTFGAFSVQRQRWRGHSIQPFAIQLYRANPEASTSSSLDA